ncbi:MAG: acyl-CoA dehydrogenase family protein [Thermoplasmata archaeon]
MKKDEDLYGILRESIKEFVFKRIEPIRLKIDEEDYFPVDVFKAMGSMGYLGVTVPEEYGGSGMGYMAQAIIEEEIAYSSPSLALSYGAHSNLCLDHMYVNGSEYVRENYVRKLVSGEWIGSLCLTEPGSGSDAFSMKTSVIDENGKLSVKGSKTFITNAPYADLLLTYAKDGDGYSALIILGSDPGFSRGKRLKKMGMRGSPTGELFFDGVPVDENRFVGKRYDGKNIILEGLNSERAILSFVFLGLARRAIDMSVQYSTDREQFSSPLYDFELIQEKLAYMYTKYESAELLALRAVEMLDKDRTNPIYAASAIMYAAESAEYIAREAIQIHGGYGYLKDTGVEYLLRDAILGQIGAGTTEIRKKVISKSMIRNYRKYGKFEGS